MYRTLLSTRHEKGSVGDLINILNKVAYNLCHLYSIAFHRSLTTGEKHNKVTAYFVLNLAIQYLNRISFNTEQYLSSI